MQIFQIALSIKIGSVVKLDYDVFVMSFEKRSINVATEVLSQLVIISIVSLWNWLVNLVKSDADLCFITFEMG